jgi:lipopolysaccharide biosynthesis glycosyltransferase
VDVFSVVDREYLKHYPTLLVSIIRNNPHRQFRFHLIWDGGDPSDVDRFHSFCARNKLSVNLIEVAGSQFEAAFEADNSGYLTQHIFYRWLIPDLLPEAKVALYLDVDIAVIGQLDELLETDLSGVGVAAAKEPATHKLEPFGVEPDGYFNSGVMLMNLDYWREHRVAEQALAFANAHPHALIALDQCALNVAIRGRVKYLDPKWNCTLANAKEYGCESPVVVHYTGRRKPWAEPWRQPYGIYFANYSQQTPWPIDYFGGERRARRKVNIVNPAHLLNRWLAELQTALKRKTAAQPRG